MQGASRRPPRRAGPELLLPALPLLAGVPRGGPPCRLYERGDLRHRAEAGIRSSSSARVVHTPDGPVTFELKSRGRLLPRSDRAAGAARALGHPALPPPRRASLAHVGHARHRPDQPLEQRGVGRVVRPQALEHRGIGPLLHRARHAPASRWSRRCATVRMRARALARARSGSAFHACRSPGVPLTTRGSAPSARMRRPVPAHLVADAEVGRDVRVVDAEEPPQLAQQHHRLAAQDGRRADEQLLARERRAGTPSRIAPVLAGDDVLVAIGGPGPRRLERLGRELLVERRRRASARRRPAPPSASSSRSRARPGRGASRSASRPGTARGSAARSRRSPLSGRADAQTTGPLM